MAAFSGEGENSDEWTPDIRGGATHERREDVDEHMSGTARTTCSMEEFDLDELPEETSGVGDDVWEAADEGVYIAKTEQPLPIVKLEPNVVKRELGSVSVKPDPDRKYTVRKPVQDEHVTFKAVKKQRKYRDPVGWPRQCEAHRLRLFNVWSKDLKWFNPSIRPQPSDYPEGIIPEVQNVIATAKLGCKLDLKEIALNACNVEYDRRYRNGLLMRIRKPRTTAQVFESGLMRCLGSRNEAEARIAARIFARKIQNLGFPITALQSFKIKNITASTDVRFGVDLPGFAAAHEEEAQYDPEMFPAVKYRMEQPPVFLQIFASGKITFLGARSRDDIYNAFKTIYPDLLKYRKEHVEPAKKRGRKRGSAPVIDDDDDDDGGDDDLEDSDS